MTETTLFNLTETLNALPIDRETREALNAARYAVEEATDAVSFGDENGGPTDEAIEEATLLVALFEARLADLGVKLIDDGGRTFTPPTDEIPF